MQRDSLRLHKHYSISVGPVQTPRPTLNEAYCAQRRTPRFQRCASESQAGSNTRVAPRARSSTMRLRHLAMNRFAEGAGRCHEGAPRRRSEAQSCASVRERRVFEPERRASSPQRHTFQLETCTSIAQGPEMVLRCNWLSRRRPTLPVRSAIFVRSLATRERDQYVRSRCGRGAQGWECAWEKNAADADERARHHRPSVGRRLDVGPAEPSCHEPDLRLFS